MAYENGFIQFTASSAHAAPPQAPRRRAHLAREARCACFVCLHPSYKERCREGAKQGCVCRGTDANLRYFCFGADGLASLSRSARPRRGRHRAREAQDAPKRAASGPQRRPSALVGAQFDPRRLTCSFARFSQRISSGKR